MVKKRNDTNPREIALRVLHDIEVNESFTDQSILSFPENLQLSSLNRRFLAELVHGTTKMKRRIDYILDLFLEKRLGKLTPWIRNILRMGIYQIDFLTKVPDSAAVDESVELAKKFGHKGTVALVNAVLRTYLREKSRVSFPDPKKDRVGSITLFYSFPDWMVEMWLGIFGEEETLKLCQAFNQRPHLGCRMNRLKTDHKTLEEIFKQDKVKFKPGRFLKDFYSIESKINLDNFAPLQRGLAYFQDESAGFPVMLLDPQPGERVVDLCAAPGGKTTMIAERMKDNGLVLAVDLNASKLRTLKENCERLGVDSVTLCCADARTFFCHPLDKVLVDAPCSALGTLGHHSDARWKKQKADLPRLQSLQLEILSNAAELLKDGGILVYSTCTIMPEENEQVMEKFLERRKDFRLADSSQFVDSSLVDHNGMVRTLPHIHKMDGSFACRLEKI